MFTVKVVRLIYRSIVGRHSVNIAVDSWSIVGLDSDDSRLTLGRDTVDSQSIVVPDVSWLI